MKKKIYVACSLTGAPQEFVDQINELKKLLREKGHEILDFLGLNDGSCDDVALHDIQKCVRRADLILAICDIPATGLGIEVGVACERNQPTIAVCKENLKVTRLIQGLGAVNPNFSFKWYRNLLQDVPDFVEAAVWEQFMNLKF